MDQQRSFQSQSKATGHEGEEEACRFITDLGYKIIKRNFNYGKVGEIDIVAKRFKSLRFIEVKARQDYVTAAESIAPWQRKRIERTAEYFLKTGSSQ